MALKGKLPVGLIALAMLLISWLPAYIETTESGETPNQLSARKIVKIIILKKQ